MEKTFTCVIGKNHFMKKSIFVMAAVLATAITSAQKKDLQPPPPPPPPPVMNANEVPPPSPAPVPQKLEVAKEQKAFFKRNPTVSSIDRNNNEVRIHLKSGKEEVFDMNNKEDVEKLKTQYGGLPVTPPPPPPPPPAPMSKHITQS